jgi:CheY-like chemotaxis protein
MKGKHHVLIVEDDSPTAEDLAELIRALGCDPVMVDNKRDAISVLSTQTFCFVLLDLEIKVEPDSIRGHEAAGVTLLTTIRDLYPDHSGRGYRLPVLVVSGHVFEAESAVAAMREGADDVIQKPIKDSRLVIDRIRKCLEKCGRAHHEDCIALPARAAPLANTIEISIPGDRDKRRTRVVVAGFSLSFTDAPLRNLLHLLAGKLTKTRIHKRDLGADDRGFKGISNLRKELAPALNGVEIIENDGEGHYWLADNVTFGSCDVDALIALNDHEITRIAEQIRTAMTLPEV